MQHGWDKKYLVNPDKHVQKVYTTSEDHIDNSWIQSLLDNPPPAGYSNCLDNIPQIEDSDIYHYFLVKCDNMSSTARKHRDNGYVFFKSGKVVSSEFKCDIDDNTLIIRGDVEASFDRGTVTGQCKKKYPVHVVCDKFSGCVLGARCLCKAGLGGYCKHVASILFQVMDSQRRGLRFTPLMPSKTARLQTWHKPSVQGQACIKFSDLNLESFDYERDTDDRTAKRQKTDYRAFRTCPANSVTKERIEKFCNALQALGTASQLTEILKANNCEPVHSTPKSPTSATSELISANVRETKENVPTIYRFEGTYSVTVDEYQFYNDCVAISTVKEQQEISRATVGQSSSSKWSEERSKRITASNFKCVATRKKVPYDNLVKKICAKPGQVNFSNKHTEWGKQAEPIALAQYKCELEGNGFIVEMQKMGLIVNPNFPYLGASPDMFVTLTKGGEVSHGLVEVKSLSKNRNLTPCEAAQIEKFYSFNDDKLEISKEHAYYYQVQGQLAICNVDWCDFVVWTPCGIEVQRVYKDNVFWNSVLPKLSDFYFRHILPALVKA